MPKRISCSAHSSCTGSCRDGKKTTHQTTASVKADTQCYQITFEANHKRLSLSSYNEQKTSITNGAEIPSALCTYYHPLLFMGLCPSHSRCAEQAFSERTAYIHFAVGPHSGNNLFGLLYHGHSRRIVYQSFWLSSWGGFWACALCFGCVSLRARRQYRHV